MEKVLNNKIIKKVGNDWVRLTENEMTDRIVKQEIIIGIMQTTLEVIISGAKYSIILEHAKESMRQVRKINGE